MSERVSSAGWPPTLYFVINRSSDGRYFYRIVRDGEETAAVSESLASSSAARAAITLLKQEVPNAPVIDLSTHPYGERRAP